MEDIFLNALYSRHELLSLSIEMFIFFQTEMMKPHYTLRKEAACGKLPLTRVQRIA